MTALPTTRNVNVVITRNDNFPSRDGFGVPLLLTTQTIADKLTATLRTRAYASINEVAADFAATDEFYKAALQAFSQERPPLLVKAGYANVTAGTSTAADLKTELDAIEDYDASWYWADVEAGLRDDAMLDGLVEWSEARDKKNMITSNDANMETLADTTNIAARHKGTVENTSVFYSTDGSEYPGFAAAAYLGTFNFDDASTAYTLKFKKLRGMAPLNKTSAVANIIQGWVPGIGRDITAGHCANCIVDQGGQFILEQGGTLTPDVFIDEIHMTHWLKARVTEEVLAVLLNNDRIPYSDNGMQILAGAVEAQLARAFRAGLVAEDVNDAGDYEPSYTVTAPSVFSVSEAQRKKRIAPAITARFRYSGAVHFATIQINVTF